MWVFHTSLGLILHWRYTWGGTRVLLWVWLHMWVWLCVCVNTHIHAYTCVCLCTHIHTYMLDYIDMGWYRYRYRLWAITTINGSHAGGRELASAECVLCAGPFHMLSHLTFTIAMKGGYYYSHAYHRGNLMNLMQNLPKITQLGNYRTWIKNQFFWASKILIWFSKL